MRRFVVPSRGVWLLALPPALLLSLTIPWLLALPVFAVSNPAGSKRSGDLRIGDSHIVSFGGATPRMKFGAREFWIFQTFEAEGRDATEREEWFGAATKTLAEIRDGPNGAPPSWGPLRELARGRGEVLPPYISRQQHALGWPWPSMAYWVEVDSPSYRLQWGWRPEWYAHMAHSNRLAFPLRPIWPRFAANFALYWIGIAAALFAILQARRQIRVRRGRCARCAYPMAGLPAAHCPECGWSPPSKLPSRRAAPARAGGASGV